MIRASAPGKVVLWGEYAVLTGAPGLVLAVDRRAGCTLTPGGGTWNFETRGLAAPAARLNRADLLGERPPLSPGGELAWHVLNGLSKELEKRQEPRDLGARIPTGATLTTDTTSFLDYGQKRGIGSSAVS